MFSGFNLKTNRDFDDYYEHGKSMYEEINIKVRKRLYEYINSNGRIDGNKLKEDWFPQINANIFLSHSHGDRRLAIGLAGWLNKEFGITVFIDSCIWGYCDDLLKDINDKYSKINESLYNYESCNYASAHVHMMLSIALNQMIDKCECVFFLNTPNSIDKIEYAISNKTNSPWIYSEIIMSQIVRKRNLTDYRKSIILEKYSDFQEKYFSKLEIDYDVTLDHLYDIDDKTLVNWESKYKLDNSITYEFYKNKEVYAMDYLYDVVGIRYKKKQLEREKIGIRR